MKKILVFAAILGVSAMFVACSDDDSSSASGGGACLNTFTDGTKQCFTGESAEFLCGGTSTGLASSVVVSDCPANPTAVCPDAVGDGKTYYYEEGMTCGNAF